ncbi:MAG: PQQ-binding-like beta-propeller repeat protein [Verrucomicrobiales bacterium]
MGAPRKAVAFRRGRFMLRADMKTLALLILAVLPAIGAADDWPNWRGPDHDGISKEKGWRTELGDPEWRVNVGIGFSSVAVAGGRLYTLGHDGKKQGGQETVYCLDAETGKEIWTFSYAAELMPFLHEGGPLSTPAVDGGHVYTIGKGGQFYCFDAETGKPAWEKDLFALTKPAIKTREWWGYAPSPLILGDLVIVESGATLAFDKKTGEEKWRSKMYVPAYGTPAAFTHGGKARLAVLKTDGLAVLDAADGKTLAFQEWTTSYRTSAATPIIAGDQIFLSTGYGTGCVLTGSPAPPWKKSIPTKRWPTTWRTAS